MTQALHRCLRAVALGGALAALARPVAAQSLAELARKEQERRKAVAPATAPAKSDKDKDGKEQSKDTKKVYTNKDLGPGGPEPEGPVAAAAPVAPGTPAPASHTHEPPPAAGQPAGQAAQSGGSASTAPGTEARDENWWRNRITTARADLQRQSLLLEALQSRVNALATDFVNRDDPAQRDQIAADRQKSLSEMERITKEIERLKKQIGEIEDEARKAGVPAGWLR
jgi:hypothetical protein